MFVNAHEETNYDESSGYVNYPYKVGEFVIPEGTPPFTPVRVPLTLLPEYLGLEPKYEWAWVAHDGQGNVQGDTSNPATDTEVAKWFADPAEYKSESIDVGP